MTQPSMQQAKQLTPFNDLVFDTTYLQLPKNFYSIVNPTSVSSSKVIKVNHSLCQQLGINPNSLEGTDGADYITGNLVPKKAKPIAFAYAGHQFGHPVGQLGDGRTILIGEIISRDNQRYDLQWKGSGPTIYSRGGDGRAPLGPVIREYIVSEAMQALGCPTTRTLAMALTGDPVYREETHPGAVLIRVASSHIRIGTFQYFAFRGDVENLKILADYTIQRHYPEVSTLDNPYLELFEKVLEQQAELIAYWMSLGFIHGVMNTDNTALSGETIDYGPCAFMDEYDPNKVFSSIDRHGRYAYQNQEHIGMWNLAKLAECLLLPMGDDDATVEKVQDVLMKYPDVFKAYFTEKMCSKLGLKNSPESNETDEQLIKDFLGLMQKSQADFTLTFYYLTMGLKNDHFDDLYEMLEQSNELEGWLSRWKERFSLQEISKDEAVEMMRQSNPVFIPRNHQVERVIQAATNDNDFAPMEELLEVVLHPFDENPSLQHFMKPPKESERVRATFCGT